MTDRRRNKNRRTQKRPGSRPGVFPVGTAGVDAGDVPADGTRIDPAVVQASRDAFCKYLVSARASSGKSLGEIATVTRIPERSLERLESGAFEELPADVFVRGFLRSYARCVGLSEDDAIKRYTACGMTPAPVASPMADELASAMATLESRAAPSYRVSRVAPADASRPDGDAAGEKLSGSAASPTEMAGPESVDPESVDPESAGQEELVRQPTSALSAAPDGVDGIRSPGTRSPGKRASTSRASANTPSGTSSSSRKRKKRKKRKGKQVGPASASKTRSTSSAAASNSDAGAPAAHATPPEPAHLVAIDDPSAGVADGMGTDDPAAVVREGKPLPSPVLCIDDADPGQAEREREQREREGEEASWKNFLPPSLLDSEQGSRRGALTLAVIILVIVATLTMSYLMRRPNDSGDGVTCIDPVSSTLDQS